MKNNIIVYEDFLPKLVLAGTTTKDFGNFKNGNPKETASWIKLAKYLQVTPKKICRLWQKHSLNIEKIPPFRPSFQNETGDGLYTQARGTVLCIKTADCMPVVIVGRKTRTAMALHAGKMGLLNGIVSKGLDILLKEGENPSDIKILAGPFIEKNCYSMDLKSLLLRQVKAKKIPICNVCLSSFCTYCEKDLFFSFRRHNEERMVTFVKLL